MIYVTGKGGAGKSTVAAKLVRRAAVRGLRTALIETGTGCGARAEPAGPSDPASTFRLDERAALGQMVARLLRIRFLAGRLMDSRAFSAVAAAAPGVRELVYMSYVFDVADGRIGGPFDLVVVDGFATGHSLAMLSSPYTSADLIPIGPAARIAREIGRVARSAERFRVVSVTLPEELAANECSELRERLDELGIAIAATVVNAAYPNRLEPDQLEWLHAARRRRADAGSNDALLYEARRARQAAVVAGIEAEVGAHATLRLPYDFEDGGGQLADDLVDALLDRCVDARRERAR